MDTKIKTEKEIKDLVDEYKIVLIDGKLYYDKDDEYASKLVYDAYVNDIKRRYSLYAKIDKELKDYESEAKHKALANDVSFDNYVNDMTHTGLAWIMYAARYIEDDGEIIKKTKFFM